MELRTVARTGLRLAIALILAACSTHAAAQATRPTPAPSASLQAYTVTYTTEEFGVVPGSGIEFEVRADGTAHLATGMAGGPLTRGPEVHLPPARLDALGRALADPSFAHLSSTPLGGEGRETHLVVSAPSLHITLTFGGPIPAAARAVVQELESLSSDVASLSIADESANGPCASDSDCSQMNCRCHCYAFPRAGPVRGGCSPGHCATEPCAGHPVCNPATHRCVAGTR